jgi:hypothetical protein
MKVFKSVELVLENCEAIEIKREHIGIFYVLNIKRSISRRAVNSIDSYTTADEVFMQICSEANVLSSYVTTCSDNDVLPFARLLNYKDITGLRIKYKDGDEEYIQVNWGGDSDYENEYQTAAINEKTGDLYIVISEKESVESYFKEYLQREDNSFWKLVKKFN